MARPHTTDATSALDRCLATSTTALLVHGDAEAIALVQRCEERRLRVPGDLSIVAYDDEVAGLFSPPLTAVRPPRRLIGRAAVRLVADRLADPDRPAHRVIISPSLRVRSSPPRHGPAADVQVDRQGWNSTTDRANFSGMALAKGAATRSAIVDEALRQTARDGLTGLSFGGLADALQLSKSGLFAHFKAKEALQLAVLDEAGARFRQRVLAPALALPAGRDRLLALFTRYLDWMGDGCVYSTIAQEIGKLPEPVEQAFRDGQRQWQQTISDLAAASVDPQWSAAITLHFVGLALAYQQAVKVFAETAARRRIIHTFEQALRTMT